MEFPMTIFRACENRTCGKTPKWNCQMHAELDQNFIFPIIWSSERTVNRISGMCRKYYNFKKQSIRTTKCNYVIIILTLIFWVDVKLIESWTIIKENFKKNFHVIEYYVILILHNQIFNILYTYLLYCCLIQSLKSFVSGYS